MKKFPVSSLGFVALALLCVAFFSFGLKGGGDFFAVYLNGKQVHQQFVQIDKRVKTLQLFTASDNDKIDVSYLHCGRVGTRRVLTLRNEKNEPMKQLTFADAADNQSFMSFYRKDVTRNKDARINLYYSSNELPEGRLLATILWRDSQAMAKR